MREEDRGLLPQGQEADTDASPSPSTQGWRGYLVALSQTCGDAMIRLMHLALLRAFGDTGLVPGRECNHLLAILGPL